MAEWPPSFPDLPALDVIGRQIAEAARAADERAAGSRRPVVARLLRTPGRRRTRLVLVALVLAGLLAGVAVAATRLIGIGRPVPPNPHGSRLGEIVPGTTRLLAVRAPDPAGGPPWGLRVFRTRSGAACVQVGRVLSGRLGILGQDGVFGNDHRFHELPVTAEGCGGLDAKGQLFMEGGGMTQTASGATELDNPAVGGCETLQERYGRTVATLRTLRAALRLQLRRGERAAARVERRVIARYERRAHRSIPLCPAADLRDVVWGFAGTRARKVTLSEHGRTWTLRPSSVESGAYLLVLPGSFRRHQGLRRRTFYPGGIVCGFGYGVRSSAGCSPPPGFAKGPPRRPPLPHGVKPMLRRPPPPMHLPVTPLLGLAIRFTPPFAGHRYEVVLQCGAKASYAARGPTALPAGRPRTLRLLGPLPQPCTSNGRVPGRVIDATTGREIGAFRLHRSG
jgi:hypothetical protein